MKKKLGIILLAMLLTAGFLFIGCDDIVSAGLLEGAETARAAETFTANKIGTKNGWDFEYWKDRGTGSMTVNDNGTFSCNWKDIGNILFRTGKKFGSTQSHTQIGAISINYNASFTPGGNSYLCVYGWTEDPLVEYYIVENYGTYNPGSQATRKGQVTIDGGTYTLYESTRTQQPSIKGTQTFKQYWSIRDSKRSSGTISVTSHFNAWNSAGLPMNGKLYEVSLTAEGYQSAGSATINSYTLKYGNTTLGSASSSTPSTPAPTPTPTPTPPASTPSAGDLKYTFSQMTFSSQSGTTYSVNGSGALSVSYQGQYKEVKYNLPSNANLANCSAIVVNGTSANGQTAVKFYDAAGAEAFVMYNNKSSSAQDWSKTLSSAEKGKTIRTIGIMSQDSANYSATINSVTFKGLGSSSSGGGTTTTPPATTTPPSTGGGTTTTATRVTCQSMTKGGQYTANTNSPFNGVILYSNNDKVSYNQYFANNSHTFTLRGCSTNNNAAQVELRIGGKSFGTFKFTGTSASNQSITAAHNSGGKTVAVELVCVNDNNTWDAKIEYLEIK